MRVDNKSTILIVENPFNMRRTRHMDIKHKKLLEWIKAKIIRLEYVASADNVADIFTKLARPVTFLENRGRILSSVELEVDDKNKDNDDLLPYDAGKFEHELQGGVT